MRKPVILLVDDDASVLEALEAALAPVFGEIARIESFTEPPAVLAELPRWEAEDRRLAVAVVDQKMPGMTGVELLARFKHRPPTRDMRSILLTGYAGLDSALAAKNDVRVDRYLEKPWDSGQIAESLRYLLARFFADSETETFFVFREVVDKEEVRRFLALRYEVYRETSGIRNVLPTGGSGMDVDAYDLVSRFFGLFVESLTDRRLAGTLRVAGQEGGPVAPVLLEIVVSSPVLHERLHAMRRHPLPLMEYLVDRDAVAALFQRLTARGERVVEPGRLALDPLWRSANGFHLARHIIESAVAFFFFLEIENALLTCVPLHVRFYRPLGFREAEGTTTCHQPLLEGEYACLHGTRAWVPSPQRERTLSFVERIRRMDATCWCSTYPSCLPEPYERGRIVDSDLFCPLRAKEVLLD